MKGTVDTFIELLLASLDLLRFWTVLHPYERGVKLRLGKFLHEVGPGIHWHWPMRVDIILSDNVVTRTVDLGGQSLYTKDGYGVTVKGVVTTSIKYIDKALLSVEGVDHALVDSCMATITRHVAGASWDELRTEDFADRLSTACRKRGWRYGLEIERVELTDLTRSRSIRLHGVGNVT